jgi:glutaredoxin-like protein NrdH
MGVIISAEVSMALTHVPGKNAGDIKVYALSTCPWCKKAKKFLEDLGVEYYFTDVDLLQGEERAQAMTAVRKWNPSASFPTIVIDNAKCIVGFREDELRAAVSKK